MVTALDLRPVDAPDATAPSRLPPSPGVLGLDGVTSCATAIKCMGRTYGVAPVDGGVGISDLTDITRPIPLGTARADGSGNWEVRTVDGTLLTGTPDLLHAVAALRRSRWPGLDQPVD